MGRDNKSAQQSGAATANRADDGGWNDNKPARQSGAATANQDDEATTKRCGRRKNGGHPKQEPGKTKTKTKTKAKIEWGKDPR